MGALVAALSAVQAQDAKAPTGAPWGSRTGNAQPARVPGKVVLRAPDDPSPGRPSGTQRAALRTLSGGPAVPPPSLSFLQEGLQTRAARHRVRADALDALAVRAARRLRDLAPAGADRHACLAANAARRALELAVTAGIQRADTAASLEAEVDLLGVGAPERTPGPTASTRLRELRAQARDRLIPELEAGGCEPRTSTVLVGGMEPRVHLSGEARRAVGGRVVFFVKVPRSTPVIWVDGAPEGLAGPDGWGVVTSAARSVTLCATGPHGDACEPSHRARPAMGDAYDLARPDSVADPEPVVDPEPPAP